MFKIKLVGNTVLGQEVMSCLDEKETLHLENHSLCDDFRRVFDLICGSSCNVHTFYDQYLRLVEKVAELEKDSPSIGMVPEAEVDRMKNELVVLLRCEEGGFYVEGYNSIS